MEERVWLACETPRPMIERLLAHPRSGVGERGWPFSERKLRLWVEACRAHTGDTDDWIDLNNHRAVMNSVMAWADISHGPGDEWARLHACRPRTRAAYLRDVIGSVNNPVSLPYYEPGHCLAPPRRPGPSERCREMPVAYRRGAEHRDGLLGVRGGRVEDQRGQAARPRRCPGGCELPGRTMSPLLRKRDVHRAGE
jgi:hypothetical protein